MELSRSTRSHPSDGDLAPQSYRRDLSDVTLILIEGSDINSYKILAILPSGFLDRFWPRRRHIGHYHCIGCQCASPR
jgi:hypothetical protein